MAEKITTKSGLCTLAIQSLGLDIGLEDVTNFLKENEEYKESPLLADLKPADLANAKVQWRKANEQPTAAVGNRLDIGKAITDCQEFLNGANLGKFPKFYENASVFSALEDKYGSENIRAYISNR